jgi:hypothetical protein
MQNDAIALGQRHEEISAFRRQEQIFATLTPDALRYGCLENMINGVQSGS